MTDQEISKLESVELAPEGVEFAINLYVKSPSAGLCALLVMDGLTEIGFPLKMVNPNMMKDGSMNVTDWRVMTRDEIKVYKAIEAADQSEIA
jgi:hypothetical protein